MSIKIQGNLRKPQDSGIILNEEGSVLLPEESVRYESQGNSL